ncbi:hypothetical protein FGG08_006189 [Glutinoglossum americanum]|uniref:U3 small nucleolar RNA-associated protein 4 n=1 Tax=Glutinoglossum americanum TaxID=1670608 RepID=A0A9P8HWV7_9PEZI|nr:hypothetical protein FGG08_006189 [Glutinoglossum americanum]
MEVHRCRFVPYPPSTINALAFSHLSTNFRKAQVPSALRLAVGRANGDIEIWNPLGGAWFHETTFRGGKDRSIEGLVWIQEPDEEGENGIKIDGKLRLFSIGYSTAVTEWDLDLGRPLRHTSGNYGEIWCLAAQPKWQPPTKETNKQSAVDSEFRGQHIIVGCADGAVVLLSTADGDLKFQRSLSRPSAKKARILSITFQNRFIVIAGCADSTIRVFDIRSGQLLRSMSLGSGPAGGPKEILVWSVKCLPRGSIVSGDSTGELRFWDGRNYTQTQRLRSHRADILDIKTSADGNTIVSGGMDRRTIVYKRIGGKGPDRRRWAKVSHKRFHSHDVKTMATFEAKNFSVIASGGIDTTPIIIPLREFGLEHHQTLPGLPQHPPIQSAPEKRLIVSWWEREVRIWHVSRPAQNSPEENEATTSDPPAGRKLAAKITLSSEENITSASLSANGGILAVSTIAEVKIFRLRERRSASGDTLRVNKLDSGLFPFKSGAKLVQFSPDVRWLLIVDNSSQVFAVRIIHQDQERDGADCAGGFAIYPKVAKLKRLDRCQGVLKAISLGALGSYDRVIIRLAFSSDSSIAVVGDLSGYLDSWVLEGHRGDTQPSGDDIGCDDSSSDFSLPEGYDHQEVTTDACFILGQRWVRNPSALLLPKLPSAPMVLSFRPSPPANPPPQLNGSAAVHPTRHSPHPYPHDLPVSEDRLFVLTSEHQMYEFEVLKGRLSAWSRQNPAKNLPETFKGIRTRAMGCFWDINASRERLWLYGSSWLWMFNISRDFPAAKDGSSASRKNKKRKRDENDLRKNTSGAGSKIRDSELETGLSRKIRKVTGLNREDQEWVSLERLQDSDVGDDEEGQEASVLAKLRQEIGEGDDDDDDNNVQGAEAAKNLTVQGRKHARPPWWFTYKYRPIMGIVPIGCAHDDGEGGLAGEGGVHFSEGLPEVVLVERPLWDVDLPPRYHGDQEWVK